ncbi:MetQ/NlpA family ABC transporter substrate-binding protein [Oceanivirga salmonicida]|uniref:MetQ/NlpA family ABC transporter substrate-binding protein n=1 Tax=Oceanivirga salmonicida TaxID=1769291 RepID=UPI00083434BA|nr:MetQ/NlpA family ABC transporter substrate-binding protein [Oceanivirga salmonicida]
MKKILKTILTICLTVVLFACGSDNKEKLVIGVSPIPHKEIVELVREDLEKEGIKLEVVVFNDYVQPNLALNDKSIDANFFQHIPYMNSFGKENNIDMISAGSIHLEPLKIYSEKIKSIEDLKNETSIEVLIPNDPTNRGRSLLLLQDAGLLKLKDSSKLDSDVEDIETYNFELNITTLNSEQIGPRLEEATIAVINTNNALASKIGPEKAIFVEGKDSPYANIVTVLRENENNEKIKKLIELLQSEKVKKYINEKYNGEVVPAF